MGIRSRVFGTDPTSSGQNEAQVDQYGSLRVYPALHPLPPEGTINRARFFRDGSMTDMNVDGSVMDQ